MNRLRGLKPVLAACGSLDLNLRSRVNRKFASALPHPLVCGSHQSVPVAMEGLDDTDDTAAEVGTIGAWALGAYGSLLVAVSLSAVVTLTRLLSSTWPVSIGRNCCGLDLPRTQR